MSKTRICDVAQCKRTYAIDRSFSADDSTFWRCVYWCIAVLFSWIVFEFRFEVFLFARVRLQWFVGFFILANYAVFGEGFLALCEQFFRLVVQFTLRIIIDKIRDFLDRVTRIFRPLNVPPPVIARQRLPVRRHYDLRTRGNMRLRSGRRY